MPAIRAAWLQCGRSRRMMQAQLPPLWRQFLPRNGDVRPRGVECPWLAGGRNDSSPKGGVSWHDPAISRGEHMRSTSPTTRRNSCVAIRNTADSIPNCSPWAAGPDYPPGGGWRSPGALSFPFEPSCPPAREAALWRDACCPGIVILVGDSVAVPDAEIIADFSAAKARHMVLDAAGQRHRIVIRSSRQCQNAYLVPSGRGLSTRFEAVSMFHTLRTSSPIASVKGMPVPTAYQRNRLDLMLRLMDLRDGSPGPGPSTREMASAAFGSDAAKLRAIDWKTSSERRRVQRLLATAAHVAARGYRDLLRYDIAAAVHAIAGDHGTARDC